MHTQSNPFQSRNIGTVGADGSITAAQVPEDGEHDIWMYRPGGEDMETSRMEIRDGKVHSPNLFGTVFATSTATNRSGIYQVESISLDEDCLVEIVASSHPCDANDVSLIAQDVVAADNSDTWVVIS